MNRFQLNMVMEEFGFDERDRYEFYDLNIYYDGRYFAIVEGKTPYKLAKFIFDNYDNYKFKIRVSGDHESKEPTSDIYTYHIDTMEGLLIFLFETNIYYSKKKTFEAIDKVLQSLYQRVLDRVDIDKSINEHMINNNKYISNIVNTNTNLDFRLRKSITLFDELAYPYLNLCDKKNNSFMVGGYIDDKEQYISLYDNKTENLISTLRKNDEFYNRLCLVFDEESSEDIYHYFNGEEEVVSFKKYLGWDIKDIEYNFTNKFIGKHYEEKKKASVEDKKFILNLINQYNNIMYDIVNINTKGKCLKRVK